jgi:heme-degrading monooxygenase HmoA
VGASPPATFVVVFVYDVDPAQVARFEAVYGPAGEWARFFAGSLAYLGTELLTAADAHAGRYVVIDRWASEEAYDAFLAAHAGEYARRNREGEALYRREQAIGRFRSVPAEIRRAELSSRPVESSEELS